MGFLSSLLVLSALSALVVATPTTRPEHEVRIPSVYNDCSGKTRPKLPNQAASIGGLAPQLPDHGEGWEEWVLLVEGAVGEKENPMFFARWARGDPSELDSKLEDGIFTSWTRFDNGSIFPYAVPGPLVYSDVGGVKTWAVGDNKLMFDGASGTWSHSLARLGFSFKSHIEVPKPGAPFNPVMDGEAGLLRGELHSRVEIPRGHLVGNVSYPWGQSYIGLKGVVTLKHLWSKKPMHDSIDSYVRGVTYLPDTPLAETVQWYQTFKDGKQVDTAQYTKQSEDRKSLDVLFQITNSPSNLKITTDSNHNSVLTFPGCRKQGGTPNLTWSTKNLRQRHAFNDSTGGVTSYYSVSISTNQWYEGGWHPAVDAGVGFIETYQRGPVAA